MYHFLNILKMHFWSSSVLITDLRGRHIESLGAVELHFLGT